MLLERSVRTPYGRRRRIFTRVVTRLRRAGAVVRHAVRRGQLDTACGAAIEAVLEERIRATLAERDGFGAG